MTTRSQRRGGRRRVSVRWVLLGIFATLVGLYLILPTLFIIPMSFNASTSLGPLKSGWTLHWYQDLFSTPSWGETALVSLEVGVLSSLLATVLGTAGTLGLFRISPRYRGLIRGLSIAPMIIPPVILGVGLYVLFLRIGLYRTLPGFVFAHTVLTTPFVVVSVSATLQQFDTQQERAAAILGANPWQRFTRVVLPQIRPGVVSGALFAFVTSWDEVVVSTFLVAPGLKTLPVEMWIQSRTSVTPTLAALSTLLMLISTVALVAMARLQRGRR